MSADYPFKGKDVLYEGVHNGIRWCIYQAPLGAVLNGYARIPDGVTLDVDQLVVHGGITYGSGECTGWIGFDTAHTGDSWDVTELRQVVGVHTSTSGADWERTWTVAALRAECERLCEQIAAVSPVPAVEGKP